MKGKKIFKYSVSVAVLATMVHATPTFASPIDSPVTQGQISQTQGQIDSLESKIQQLDNQVVIAMNKSQQMNDAIIAQQGKIDETKAEIEKAKKDLDAHKQVYSDRLRSYQLQGQEPLVTYAELLLSSKNLSEFLTRSTAITQILQSDTDLMNGLNEKAQKLQDAEQQLHNELDNLQSSRDELAAEQKQIEDSKSEVEKELAASKSALQQQKSQMSQQQPQPTVIQRVEQTSISMPDGGAGLPNSAKASRVIAVAEQYLGIPYVWGGTSPSGFDCSGLMQYVFHSVGVSLPRTAHEQQNVGTRISPSQVQPGDLVFKGDPAYHVGMYIGNGQWIQSPETGDVVKISSYNPSAFSSAARVLR